MIALQDIVSLLDSKLQTSTIRDASVALNGLQIENNGHVTRVALAVDASQKTIDAAIAAGADLLIVHHGIFWAGHRTITGWWHHKLTSCLNNNLAIYASHLPLDLHPQLGNNARIAAELALSDTVPELEYSGVLIGIAGHFEGTVAELKTRFERILSAPVTGHIATPDAPAGRIAVCSGGAGDEIYQMHAKGYRTFITGEENHWVQNAAEDIGMNLLFGGHYATETFGVKALGDLLAKEFALPTVFIDHPTGM